MQDDRFLKIVGARQPKPILLLTHGNRNRSSVATVGQSGPVTGFFSVQQPDFGTLDDTAFLIYQSCHWLLSVGEGVMDMSLSLLLTTYLLTYCIWQPRLYQCATLSHM